MKILAIEKEIESVEWNNPEKLLEQEAFDVLELRPFTGYERILKGGKGK